MGRLFTWLCVAFWTLTGAPLAVQAQGSIALHIGNQGRSSIVAPPRIQHVIDSNTPGPNPQVNKPVDIGSRFSASGWMGDGEQGKTYILYSEDDKSAPHSREKSIKITYTFGPLGWAGIYWQNTARNFGSRRGNKYPNEYSKITFWAKGAAGGEILDFKAGGINSNDQSGPYKDSFFRAIEGVELANEWRQYSIDVRDADLSSVIGGFCWAASQNDNPNRSSITFYLEAITLE
jgi:hypothetical protein